MRGVAHALIALLLSALLSPSAGDLLFRDTALAASCSRGQTYREALAAKAEARRAARCAAELAAAQAREERFIESKTRLYSERHGRRVGRWFGLVYAYWPRAEWDRAMLCIRRESGGDPGCNRWGLLQLMCYPEGMPDPERNIDRGHRLWRARGWRPWTTMREFW